ncbi:MAG: electron transfer flavoprotein subunit beta/FixA family protein, partial [Thermoplasmata archaeon]|nr:electron transfer flavoprotein subunit beta/FixA family protein [Thermoplasmata archaeon]
PDLRRLERDPADRDRPGTSLPLRVGRELRMEILVLIKPVPDPETRLRPNATGTALDADGVKWVLTGYDESAVEQALLLKESAPGSRVRAMAFGPAPRTEEILRSALALGCDAATWVEQPPNLAPDPMLSARALAWVCLKIPFDLMLVGKQALDDEAGLVGPAVAETLGVADYGPVVDLRWDAAAGRFTFARAIEGGLERMTAAGPMVVCLQQAWNDPRTAKLQNVLKARRIIIDKIAWTEVQTGIGPAVPGTRLTAFRLPPPRTGAKMVGYKTPEEAAQQLVRLLREEAKVLP